MSPDEKQALIKKIDELPPQQRKRVEGYVDALLESSMLDSEVRGKGDGNQSTSVKEDEEYLDLSLRGALEHLRDQYTSVELQHKIQEEWRRQALDS